MGVRGPHGLLRHEGRILKPYLNKAGYPVVSLARDGIKPKFLVHVLVLQAFVGPRPDGMDGCHNNGQPSDARLSNLRWDTKRNNFADRIAHGTTLRGEQGSNCKLTLQQVAEIRASQGRQKEIAQRYGISQQQVSRIKSGTRWGHSL